MTQKFLGRYQDAADALQRALDVNVEYTGTHLQITCANGDVFLLGAYRETDDGRAYMSIHQNPPKMKAMEG